MNIPVQVIHVYMCVYLFFFLSDKYLEVASPGQRGRHMFKQMRNCQIDFQNSWIILCSHELRVRVSVPPSSCWHSAFWILPSWEYIQWLSLFVKQLVVQENVKDSVSMTQRFYSWVCTQEKGKHALTETCTCMCIALLFVMTKKGEQPKAIGPVNW